MKDYDDFEIEKIYCNEHIERQKIIDPIEMPWEQKVAMWKVKEYKGKDFQVDAPVILTEKGEQVRSKSEKKIIGSIMERLMIQHTQGIW